MQKAKERLFCNAIHGIIESVDKMIIQKRTGFMENIDHNAHSVYLMYYHLIMVVKYRRKVINDPISERAKEIWELSKFINAYKSASSRLLKKEYPEIRENFGKKHSGARVSAF